MDSLSPDARGLVAAFARRLQEGEAPTPGIREWIEKKGRKNDDSRNCGPRRPGADRHESSSEELWQAERSSEQSAPAALCIYTVPCWSASCTSIEKV